MKILVIQIARELLKAIDKSRLVKIAKYVFSGKYYYINHYWISPVLPKTPNAKVLSGIAKAEVLCRFFANKNPDIENAYIVDRWGRIQGPILGNSDTVYIGNDDFPGGAVVHFHTKGKSFSIDDIEVYFAKKLAEIVIIHSSGKYVFRSDHRLWNNVISRYENAIHKTEDVNAIMTQIGHMEGVYYADIERE